MIALLTASVLGSSPIHLPAGNVRDPAPHACLPGRVSQLGELLHERDVEHDERVAGELDSLTAGIGSQRRDDEIRVRLLMR